MYQDIFCTIRSYWLVSLNSHLRQHQVSCIECTCQ